MKVLFIGGTGNISQPCVETALAAGHEVTLLTRGQRPSPFGDRVRVLQGDREESQALETAAGEGADAVVDFVAYHPRHVEAAIAAFAGRTALYIFISST